MEYKVKIDAFEGPLDLLLHLIKKLEIDIYDIPVAEITDQYLDFIHHMQKLELNIASDYLLMAATLIAMKSRMLLPRPVLADEEEGDAYEDPALSREALMHQLLEYRHFKEIAAAMKEKEQERMQLFAKPPSDLTAYGRYPVALVPLADRATVGDMLRAFQRLLFRRRMEKPPSAKIDRQVLPIGRQMKVLIRQLRCSKDGLSFQSLCVTQDRSHLVVTFLALLELMKINAVVCRQHANFDDIWMNLGEGADDFETGENPFDY